MSDNPMARFDREELRDIYHFITYAGDHPNGVFPETLKAYLDGKLDRTHRLALAEQQMLAARIDAFIAMQEKRGKAIEAWMRRTKEPDKE